MLANLAFKLLRTTHSEIKTRIGNNRTLDTKYVKCEYNKINYDSYKIVAFDTNGTSSNKK